MYVQFKVSTKIYTIIQRYLDTHVFFDKMYFNLQNYKWNVLSRLLSL